MRSKSKAELTAEIKTLQTRIHNLETGVAAQRDTTAAPHLREQEFRALVEHCPDVIARFDSALRHSYVSPAVQVVTGLLPEAFIGKTNRELGMQQDLAERWETALRQVFETGQEVCIEFVCPSPDGPRDYESRLFPERAEDGTIAAVFSIAREVTEQKRVEEALRGSAARFRSFWEHSMDGFLLTHPDGRILMASPAACRILGRSEEEICRIGRAGVVDSTDPRLSVLLEERARTGKCRGELRLIRPDGTPCPCEITSAVFTGRDGLPWTSMCIRDITERKRAEEALWQSEQHFRMLYEQSPVTYQSLDAEGRILDLNDAWLELLGYGRDEVIGHWFGDFFVPSEVDLFRERFSRFKATGEIRGAECDLLHKDGSLITVSIDGRIARDETGAFKWTHCVLHNITERKQMEEALEQNRAELRAIYQQAPVMMCVVDADRRVLYANRLFTEFTGVPESDLLAGHACGVFGCVNALTDPHGCGFGQSCEDCSLRLAIEDTFKTGCGRRDIERRLTLERNGIRRDVVLLVATALIRAADRSTLLLCLQDITARKRVEEALVRRTRQLDAIRAVSFEISRELDLPTLLELINRRAAELVGATSGTVRLWDEQAGLLIPVAWHGLGEWMKDQSRRLGEGVAGTVAQRREGMIVNDYRASPYVHPAALERPEITAVLGEPLVYRDHLLGVLTVGKYGHGSSFTEGDQELLRLFAIQAAIAIENARLFEEVRAGRERLQALSRRQLEVHESERRLLARELHDEIGQLLTGLKLTLDMVAGEASDTGQSLLRESQDLVGELIGQVRELSLNLRPAVLDDLGLLPALLWQFERYTTRTQIQVDFQHAGLERRPCPSEVETAAYRIVQEALTNVARHAEASEAQVRLWVEGGKLLVRIEDQGRGFEPTITLGPEESSGLAGMHERAMLLGGRLRIESSPGAGTRIQAELPLGEPERGS